MSKALPLAASFPVYVGERWGAMWGQGLGKGEVLGGQELVKGLSLVFLVP